MVWGCAGERLIPFPVFSVLSSRLACLFLLGRAMSGAAVSSAAGPPTGLKRQERVFMPWETSNRRERLPVDWQARRKRVLERCGYRCEWMITREERCPEKATDVDHIKPGDDHSFRNLRGLCSKHHARKSSSEGWWARKRLIEESKQKFRKQETHPAYLNADGSTRGGMLNVEDSDANKSARRRQAEPRRPSVSWRSPTDQNTPPPQTVA